MAAAGLFSRQAGTQGKAKILRTLLGGSFWDTCGFDVKAYFKGCLASEPSAAEALDHQPVDMAFQCPGRGGLPLALLDKLGF